MRPWIRLKIYQRCFEAGSRHEHFNIEKYGKKQFQPPFARFPENCDKDQFLIFIITLRGFYKGIA